jgi:divalent metal cation (Fe/Co/Zn/Cd) transporter
VPTVGEILTHSNTTSHQSLPLVFHTIAIIYLVHTSTGEASLVALAFLALNDLLAAIVELTFRTMDAFDVWRTGTLRFPCGLQRVEGLAGFGLGVFATFNGLYVLKETIEDIIISFSMETVLLEGSSGGHHHHHHYIEANPLRLP